MNGMGKASKVAIERKLHHFKLYCKLYWDLIPERKVRDEASQELIPIVMGEPADFYPALLALRRRGLWPNFRDDGLHERPDFHAVWQYQEGFYRHHLLQQEKRMKKRERQRARKHYRARLNGQQAGSIG
jgi:hypothetical protein